MPPFFIDNIRGATVSLGAASVVRARPDGYTLLLGGSITHTSEALLKTRPLYNPDEDLDPIMCLAVYALVIAVHPSVPATTLKELVAYAKANPGKLSYGHVGVGSNSHLAGELFKSLAGIPDVAPVPYRGAGPLIPDLISGHLPVGIVAVTGRVSDFIGPATSESSLSPVQNLSSRHPKFQRRRKPAFLA